MSITIKTEAEIAIMRKAGKLLAQVMACLAEEVRAGKTTLEIDELAEKLILEGGARPAFKGYGGGKNPFPATICASLNNE
ncbi:MAG: M24 family metallopeptidase, partial [Candidatus Moraniibacteriota bacterium]